MIFANKSFEFGMTKPYQRRVDADAVVTRVYFQSLFTSK